MKKILIAEDDNFLSNALDAKLKQSGYEVKVTGNGNDALKEAKWMQPDLILLDLKMPELDGFEFLRKFKNKTAYPDSKVIVFTNFESEESRQKARVLGADDYKVKANTSLKELHELVFSYLKE